jgi:hypothetical protein
MSMTKLILAGGAVVGVGALGAVALGSSGTPAPVNGNAALTSLAAPAPEARTETVTRVIHRVRHERAQQATTAARATPVSDTVLRAASQPAARTAAVVATPAPVPLPAPAAVHDPGDDHGGGVEPGDDHGGAVEPGDDNGGGGGPGGD